MIAFFSFAALAIWTGFLALFNSGRDSVKLRPRIRPRAVTPPRPRLRQAFRDLLNEIFHGR